MFVAHVDSRRLMNVESEPVAGAVKKTLHAASGQACGKALTAEVIEDFLVDVEGVCAIANPSKTDFLSFFDAPVRTLQALRSASSNNGTSDVTEVTRRLGAGENIHNDRCVCPDRPGSLVVWIDTLISGSDNGVAGHISPGHDGCINDPFENLGGEPCSVEVKITIRQDSATTYSVDSCLHPAFCCAKRVVDEPDLFPCFQFAIRPERIGSRVDADLHLAKLIGQSQRKRRGHFHLVDFQIPEYRGEHLSRGWKRRAFLLQTPHECGVSQHCMHTGLTLRAVDLEVAHHQITLAALFNENEGIWSKEAGRPQHVGVTFTGAVDQPRVVSVRCRHVIVGPKLNKCRKQPESSSSGTKFSPAKPGTKTRYTSCANCGILVLTSAKSPSFPTN